MGVWIVGFFLEYLYIVVGGFCCVIVEQVRVQGLQYEEDGDSNGDGLGKDQLEMVYNVVFGNGWSMECCVKICVFILMDCLRCCVFGIIV